MATGLHLPECEQPGTGRKKAWPTAVILDTQSVKNAATATGATVGFDAGKLVKGRRRLGLTDTLGNVLASSAVPANSVDGAAAITFWDAVVAAHDLLDQRPSRAIQAHAERGHRPAPSLPDHGPTQRAPTSIFAGL